MEFSVKGKRIVFSEKEMSIFEEVGLELDSEFIELLLHFNMIDDIQNMDEVEVHNICIKAFMAYRDLILKHFGYLKKGYGGGAPMRNINALAFDNNEYLNRNVKKLVIFQAPMKDVVFYSCFYETVHETQNFTTEQLTRELCGIFGIEFEELMLDVTPLSAEYVNEDEGFVWVNKKKGE